MVKHKQAQETKSKVKLYKTKRGWFTALTRFFGLLSFMSKKEVQPIDLNDLDALKDADTSDNYKKGIATVATLFGMGAIGAVSPTEVHAATTTVDYSSQVIGSGSTSVSTSTSQSMTSTSGSTASQSTSTSTVSQSMQSNSLSVNSVSGSTTSTTIFEGTTDSSVVSENSDSSISASQSAENNESTILEQSGSISNSTADSLTGSTSLDNEKTPMEESASTSYLEGNGTSAILPATGNNDGETSVANRTVVEDNIVQLAENIREVSNEEELKAALQNASITTIKLTNNITLNNAITINNGNRNITIIGDGHYINATNADGGIFLNNNSNNKTVNLTIENATLYNTSQYGFVHMNNNGTDNVTYKDVTAYGGTLVWSQTNAGTKVLNIAGNTNLHSVESYDIDGTNYKTKLFAIHGGKTSALYVSNAINILDNANVTLDNEAANYDMWLIADSGGHSWKSAVTVGNNATLNMNNIGQSEINIKLDGAGGNVFTVGENATVNMSAKIDNVQIVPRGTIFNAGTVTFEKGSNVVLEVKTGSNLRMGGSVNNIINFNGNATLIKHQGVAGGSIYSDNTESNIEFNFLGGLGVFGGNEVKFNPGTDVTFKAGPGASNIGTYNKSIYGATVTIDDPLRVAFTDKVETNNGLTYLGNNGSSITVNVNNATIKVNDNEFSELISSNKTTITNGGSTVSVGSVSLQSNSQSYDNESESLSASLSFSVATSMAGSQLAAVNNADTSQVIYGGSTSLYNSQSMSTSLSISTSTSLSESLSTSLGESLSMSVSLSESISTSTSLSESLSTSLSESLSTSVSLSESISTSISLSESLSISLSESLSNSVSVSESMSNSVSMSESMSNSVSMSESMSNSVSMSESLSNSISMSESLSNSVSMSESMSNSVSMSES
ncbi:serine-rich glycoprotein adhesin, partial [Limosilactobacillus reuteri]|uniref:serine-rich glycoprotein adhesin n=1 Tax=Limosilactobacillus reuteri TaxID=1598 RepID=UPI001E54CEE7